MFAECLQRREIDSRTVLLVHFDHFLIPGEDKHPGQRIFGAADVVWFDAHIDVVDGYTQAPDVHCGGVVLQVQQHLGGHVAASPMPERVLAGLEKRDGEVPVYQSDVSLFGEVVVSFLVGLHDDVGRLDVEMHVAQLMRPIQLPDGLVQHHFELVLG